MLVGWWRENRAIWPSSLDGRSHTPCSSESLHRKARAVCTRSTTALLHFIFGIQLGFKTPNPKGLGTTWIHSFFWSRGSPPCCPSVLCPKKQSHACTVHRMYFATPGKAPIKLFTLCRHHGPLPLKGHLLVPTGFFVLGETNAFSQCDPEDLYTTLCILWLAPSSPGAWATAPLHWKSHTCDTQISSLTSLQCGEIFLCRPKRERTLSQPLSLSLSFLSLQKGLPSFCSMSFSLPQLPSMHSHTSHSPFKSWRSCFQNSYRFPGCSKWSDYNTAVTGVFDSCVWQLCWAVLRKALGPPLLCHLNSPYVVPQLYPFLIILKSRQAKSKPFQELLMRDIHIAPT